MGQHLLHFTGRQVQFVFPQVPVLDVRIDLHHFVVGAHGGNARVTADNAAVGKQDFAVVFRGVSGIGNGIGQEQIGFTVLWRRVESQERVAKHG